MSGIDKKENVEKQYSNDRNLSARIGLHAKYSTNREGFANWLFGRYDFSGALRILELGCGNGAQWEGRFGLLPPGCLLILSDLSEGMVGQVRKKYRDQNGVIVRKIDIQDIPFPDGCFDIVIANHMLYHVPGLQKAISEVRRVLKNSGVFYASTNGNGGMRSYLNHAFKQVDPRLAVFSEDLSFSLQNGAEILHPYFSEVSRTDYEDSLSVTDTRDLMEWIRSTITMENIGTEYLQGLSDFLERIRKKEGAILIPKETGLFISRK